MNWKIKKRLKGDNGNWRPACHGATFESKEHAEKSIKIARDNHPEYEYKMVEWPHKFPYQR